MKVRFLVALAILANVVFLFSAEEKEKPAEQTRTVFRNQTTLFEFDEDSAVDGYKWVLDTSSPNMKVVLKNTTQKKKDGFDITFDKNGTYTLVFKYVKIRDKKTAKKTITQPVKVIEDVNIVWHTDWNEVLQTARKEKKMILLLFTGSDWCGPCKSLETNIIMTKEFETLANANFILYKADFPKHSKVENSIYRQNYDLYHKYSIKGYPTTIVLDSAGEQKGKVSGYSKEYINSLSTILKEK